MARSKASPPRPREAAERDGPHIFLACRPCRENFLEALEGALMARSKAIPRDRGGAAERNGPRIFLTRRPC
eukprot:9471798-Pyramimonas_sp.AAC.1